MTVASMRAIDRYLGVVLCWIAGMPRFFSGRSVPPGLLTEPKRILVIKLFGLGSIVLATPAIASLKSTYPDAYIDLLTFENNKGLAERYPMIHRSYGIRTSSAGGFIADTMRVLSELRRNAYDAVFDFEFFSKYSTLMATLTGSPVRAGFSLPTRWRSLHLTHQASLDRKAHVSTAFLSQVVLLTGRERSPGIAELKLYPSDESSLLAKLPLNGTPFIVVNVNAGDTFVERRWPGEKFASLVDALAGELPHDFYWIGLAGESDYVNSVIARARARKRCYNIAGLLSVPELAVLLKRSDLLISNDSGPVHLADSLGVRTIALFGPESPAFYGPTGIRSRAITKQIECSPCMNVYAAKAFRCPYDAKCMKAIPVDEVVSVVEAVLEKV